MKSASCRNIGTGWPSTPGRDIGARRRRFSLRPRDQNRGRDPAVAAVRGDRRPSIQSALAAAREGATEMDLARAFHGRTIAEGGLPVLGCIGLGRAAR